ncbi:MAG TPA: hypothetical protein VL382_11755 [Terriglobales bacterium]|nr:hypothetical protein [Terriglobales bacterium]
MKYLRITSITAIVLLALAVMAQQKRETYQANARGTSTQMGRMVSVNIIIEQYSSDDDRQMLVETFEKGGSDALSDMLEKMPSKGRIAITGTLGYDIAYVRVFPTPNGRKIRILTSRPVRMGEVRNDTRSSDYDMSALEMDFGPGKEAKGVLLPACQFMVDKKTRELQIETYQNPWELTNIIDWGAK